MRSCNLALLSHYFSLFCDSDLDSIFKRFGIKIKDRERVSIENFVSEFDVAEHTLSTIELLEDTYFGYVIPQIGKEFDCLWIGKDHIVNVELKSEPIPEDKIREQLQKNYRYLNALKRKYVSLFTFESKTKTCYALVDGKGLVQVTMANIVQSLEHLKTKDDVISGTSIDKLFVPSDYLVSPFNSTDDFLRGQYFLTDEQDRIKKDIIYKLSEGKVYSLAITGPAGSGKTLLLYDIARTLMCLGKRVGIAHCGSLNEGHDRLISSGWIIKNSQTFREIQFDPISTSSSIQANVNDIDILLVDEAQRDYLASTMIESVVSQGKRIIISYDPVQCLRDEEKKYCIDNVVKTSASKLYTLKASIRTNDSLRGFVKAVFNKTQPHRPIDSECVDVSYCDNIDQLEKVLLSLQTKGYTIPKFTPSKQEYRAFYYETWFLGASPFSAHQVIGQEFDKIACIIGPYLSYNSEGNLVSNAEQKVYSEVDMLYQIMTRARKKLHIVVYKNIEMYRRCLELLSR